MHYPPLEGPWRTLARALARIAALAFAIATTLHLGSAASAADGHLVFDGENDFLVIADDESLDPLDAITVEAWIRPDTLANSTRQDRVISRRIVYELTVSTGDNGCDFGTQGDVQWKATIGGASRRICGGQLTPGSWHHVAGSYDGSKFSLYLDGVLVASATRSGSIKTSSEDLEIGSQPGNTRYFDGAIDDVRLWAVARSATEIAANLPLSGNEPGLIALFDFEEGGGQDAFDRSSNGNHATLGSSAGPDASDPLWVTQGLPLEQLFLTPQSAQLLPGASVAFVASGLDSDGVPIPVFPTWTATGGTIDPNGLFSAGQTPGTFLVTAFAQGVLAQASVTITGGASNGAPYPQSPVFSGIEWADESTIVREAPGSDNWPLTWALDDRLYTAYGDGWGFEPLAPAKLSLGLAFVPGGPTNPMGQNIPSPTGEQPKNDGRAGKKASGLLMVDDVLYMWVRNADGNGHECELAWSTDDAQSWTWSSWRFAELGYCVFLNFGRNYAGARDEYVYMYSPDTPDAYHETDDVVLTRVRETQLSQQGAYEFFAGLDSQGAPQWSTEIGDRAPVFTFADASNRLSVVYNEAQGRYLMTMRSAARAGGEDQFSIFDAPEPWGPWTTVYLTESWEGQDPAVDQWGEAQQIPSKWIGPAGTSFYLVFSGGDQFSVRQATLLTDSGGGDTIPPTVVLDTPSAGAQLSGSVGVGATASDNTGVASLAFLVDGVPATTLFSAPYAFSWNSNSVADGPHTISALASDAAGNSSVASVQVSVDNGTPNGGGDGSSLDFDGNDDQLLILDAASLDFDEALSIEAWIRPNSIASSTLQDRIVSKRFVYELTVSTGDTGCHFGSAGDVQWRATIGGANRRICGGTLIPGTWHHLAGTYDGSTFALYVDGVLVASTPRSGSIKISGDDLEIGSQPGKTRHFDGVIDEVRLWSRARSPQEIQNESLGPLLGNEAGLEAYYRFEEGSGQTAFDSSPNGNHGTLGSSDANEAADPDWGVATP